MTLGIDASNIRAGGGLTHLVELLQAANPKAHGFNQVIVWSGTRTLGMIADRPWLLKIHDPLLDRSLFCRVYWQRFRLAELVKAAGCKVLLVPGGSDASGVRPIVAMSQNLLPFAWREMRRYGLSGMTLKLLSLRFTQSRTFRRANGVIFLTEYARDAVLQVLGGVAGRTAIVSHGIDRRFLQFPRAQREITEYDDAHPFRILYVSIVDMYKHQWNVVEAVARLRAAGLPVVLDLVGAAYRPALKRLQQKLKHVDSASAFVRYLGAVPHAQIGPLYHHADLFVFASSCETFGQIVTEAMSCGLPIACSGRSAMQELLKDAGVYFDPERPDEIAEAIRTLIDSPALRAEKAQQAFQRSQSFSWQRCADETFSVLAEVAGSWPRKSVQIEHS